MSTPNNNDAEFERVLKERMRTKKEGATGILPSIRSAFYAAKNLCVRVATRAYRIVRPLVRPAIWTAKNMGRGAARTFHYMAYRKDKATGEEHFDLKRLGKSALIAVIAATIAVESAPMVVMGAYYYGTEQVFKDVYVGNAGVFVNQNFVHPNQGGQPVAPRDEIFTVLGHQALPNGEIRAMRFDIDTNLYFGIHRDALRPDLAAAKILAQSPNGVVCNFETTGIYNRIPRYFQSEMVKYWDLRPHIVNVIGCQQLDANYHPVTAPFRQTMHASIALPQPTSM